MSSSGSQDATSASGEGAAAASTSNASKGAPEAAKRPAAQGNPAFRMMGLPRLRLPSRNWLIFLSVTGSIASAIYYDKYQTRRNREKWCDLVSHLPDEILSTDRMPRRMTVYLCAPPGDGLRGAREHFHTYVKPVLVAAAMDWDVVEGRKEGDIRFKTAERIRRRRKKAGEGEPLSQEEWEKLTLIDDIRKKNGTEMWDGVAGDLVIGRHTWKEYIRGLHEGWLGPADPPKQPEAETPSDAEPANHAPGVPSLGDAAVKAAAEKLVPSTEAIATSDQDASPTADTAQPDGKAKEDKKKKEDEPPKPRQPPPYIQPTDYASLTPAPSTPDLLGPSIGVRLPHILGFRNTPIRIYRFFNRRHLADSVGRDVATAILASYRPYETASSVDEGSASGEKPEQAKVLEQEEGDWWKTTYAPRKEHEESIWIENIVLDERIAGRMRAFQLLAEDEDRARRLGEGKEVVEKKALVESGGESEG